MNVVHKWECSLPSNYKKMNNKDGFFTSDILLQIIILLMTKYYE